MAVCALLCAAPAHAATSPVAAENALPGSASWGAVRPTTAIEGYGGATSVAPGETLELHVAASVPARYRIDVYRLGWYRGLGGRRVACLPSCDGDKAAPLAPPRPVPDPATGIARAGWPVTDVLVPSPLWVSGYYEARLVVTSGPASGGSYAIYFVVREPLLRPSAILVQVPVNTWQAYNSWAGKSLYGFSSDGGTAANRVSFDRPYSTDRAGNQASPLEWEIQVARFLEREGYDVSYQTDVDTDRDPASLLRHRLVITVGHGEYWTKGERDAFDAARADGTNLAFMGSNTGYWQVRYEDDRRTIVGYKSASDPNPDPALKTMLFRALVPPRYECALLGVMHIGGLGQADYAVTAAGATDPWLQGTGLGAGATLPNLVGREYDRVPGPYVPTDCQIPRLTVLFHHDAPPGQADAVRYTAASGARVFASGSLQFGWGLDDSGNGDHGAAQADPRLQQFMRNALADMTRPEAPLVLGAVGTASGVRITAGVTADPRLQRIVIYRHPGPDAFAPGDAGSTPVCASGTGRCLDRGVAPGATVRYAACEVDAWGTSVATISAPVARRPRG
ncbi:MAG TPA: N,N-dimethylformamidase beta subunit family domain-containing protein [Gaiellaceae bacterium]|nr:N,N-dimethylformamidase beta subunit family domain-containing protein [Gaiellaceae bacterium]